MWFKMGRFKYWPLCCVANSILKLASYQKFIKPNLKGDSMSKILILTIALGFSFLAQAGDKTAPKKEIKRNVASMKSYKCKTQEGLDVEMAIGDYRQTTAKIQDITINNCVTGGDAAEALTIWFCSTNDGDAKRREGAIIVLKNNTKKTIQDGTIFLNSLRDDNGKNTASLSSNINMECIQK